MKELTQIEQWVHVCIQFGKDYWFVLLLVFLVIIALLFRCRPCPECGSRSLRYHGRAAIRVDKEKGGAASPLHNYQCVDCGLFYDPTTGLADDPQPKKIVKKI